jgi:hypothetical protein
MTYTSLATPVPNTLILVSTFGALVKQDLDDLDGRVAANSANMGTWSGGTAISRIQQLEAGNFAKFSQTTGAQTLGASNVKMQFNTTTTANTAIVTAGGTNQDTFTAVKAGSYFIAVNVRCVTAGALPELAIYAPGSSAFAVGNVKGPGSGGTRSASACTQLQLNAGDTFAVNCFNGGTSSAVDTSWGTATNITIHYQGL